MIDLKAESVFKLFQVFSLFFNQRACPDWISNCKNQTYCKNAWAEIILKESNKRWFVLTWKSMDKCTNCQYNSISFQYFTLPENTDSTFLGSYFLRLYEYLPDSCGIENSIGNVKRTDIMLLFKELKKLVKRMRTLLHFFLFVLNTIAKLETEA